MNCPVESFPNHPEAWPRARRQARPKATTREKTMFSRGCLLSFFVSPGFAGLLKIKRASRSLLRQVLKLGIPFDTVIKIQKIRIPKMGPPFGPL